MSSEKQEVRGDKSRKRNALQLAIGLAIHQVIRKKEMVNFLHGFGMSAENNCILRVEAQIEKHVVQRMERSGGIYVPPDVVPGHHVFFAVDNVDFAEDTADGKRMEHNTNHFHEVSMKFP